MAEFVRVGAAAAVPDGEIREFDLPGLRIAVACVDGRFHAFGGECTVEGCLLAEGTIEDGEAVVCPDDSSAFDLATGEPLRGPAVDPVAVYPVRVEQGWLEVAVG
jgi:3-phenylpropionate/trans-cinnamate dioxygenase ferredoxin component